MAIKKISNSPMTLCMWKRKPFNQIITPLFKNETEIHLSMGESYFSIFALRSNSKRATTNLSLEKSSSHIGDWPDVTSTWLFCVQKWWKSSLLRSLSLSSSRFNLWATTECCWLEFVIDGDMKAQLTNILDLSVYYSKWKISGISKWFCGIVF